MKAGLLGGNEIVESLSCDWLIWCHHWTPRASSPIPKWPICAAMNKGVASSSVCEFGTAPKAKSISATCRWPFWHETYNGVALVCNARSTWALWSSKNRTVARCPFWLAINQSRRATTVLGRWHCTNGGGGRRSCSLEFRLAYGHLMILDEFSYCDQSDEGRSQLYPADPSRWQGRARSRKNCCLLQRCFCASTAIVLEGSESDVRHRGYLAEPGGTFT